MAYANSERTEEGNVLPNQMIWADIPLARFMDYQSEIRVIWLQRFDHTDTRFRESIIDSVMVWKKFSATCLLPWYKNGLDWSHPDSEHYSLEEYAHERPDSELGALPDKPILTAFHSMLNLRLIVDACHRSVAIQSMVNKKTQTIPRVRVIECYGTQVHAVFPCDFCNLTVRAMRKTMPTTETEQ